MTLQQLRDFLAVLEHGSFRAAARFGSVSQAGLTNSVKALEASLGSVLLIRGGRGVQLTPQGERLRIRARLIDAEAHRAVAELRALSDEQQGPVRVGFSPTPSALLLPLVVQDFRARYPRAGLRLMGGLFERLLPAVRQGQLDFAVLSLPESGVGDGIKSQVIMTAEMAVVGRRGHPLARVRTVRELAEQEWILMGPAGAPGGTVIRYFAEMNLPVPRIAVTCDSFTQVMSLLGGTDYLALLPRMLLERDLLGNQLAEIPVREKVRSYDVAIAQRADVPMPPMAVTLAAMLRSCARSIGLR